MDQMTLWSSLPTYISLLFYVIQSLLYFTEVKWACFSWRCQPVKWFSKGHEKLRCNRSKALCNSFWLFPPPSPLEKNMWRDIVKGTAVHTGLKKMSEVSQEQRLGIHCVAIDLCIWTQPTGLLPCHTTSYKRGAGWPAAVGSTAPYVLKGDEGQGKPTWLRLSAEGTLLRDQGQPPCWDSQQKRKQKAHMVHMPLAFLGLTWFLKSAGKQSWGGNCSKSKCHRGTLLGARQTCCRAKV